jgi:hypothetical protein
LFFCGSSGSSDFSEPFYFRKRTLFSKGVKMVDTGNPVRRSISDNSPLYIPIAVNSFLLFLGLLYSVYNTTSIASPTLEKLLIKK